MMGLDPNLTAGSEYLVSSHRSVAASIYWAGILARRKGEGGRGKDLGSSNLSEN